MDAARSFAAFGTTGDVNTRKRELAAFFGQTSHETTGKLLLLLLFLISHIVSLCLITCKC